MAVSNLFFNSKESIDKIVYTKNDTVSVPNATNPVTTFAHNQEYPFLPLISYSWDGNNWYSDMGTAFQFYATAGVYMPVLNAYVDCDDTNINIHWFNGPFGNKTVQYRIVGISRE